MFRPLALLLTLLVLFQGATAQPNKPEKTTEGLCFKKNDCKGKLKGGGKKMPMKKCVCEKGKSFAFIDKIDDVTEKATCATLK